MRSAHNALALALLTFAAASPAAAQEPSRVADVPTAPLATPPSAIESNADAAVREGGLRAVPAAVSTAWTGAWAGARITARPTAWAGDPVPPAPTGVDDRALLPAPPTSTHDRDSSAPTASDDPSPPAAPTSWDRITLPNGSRTGNRDRLSLGANATDASLRTTAATADLGGRISRSGKHGAIAGAVVGTGAGALLGWFLYAACESGQGCDTLKHDVMGGAVVGAVTGAVAGWALGELWGGIRH